MLALKMLENSVGSDAIKYLEGDVLYFDDIGFSSKELNSIIDGNARIGMQSLPVQYFLGDNSVSAEMIGNAKRIDKLYMVRNRKIRDVMHKLSNGVIAYAITNEIDTIVIGHNNGWKQSVDIGKKNNQNYV